MSVFNALRTDWSNALIPELWVKRGLETVPLELIVMVPWAVVPKVDPTGTCQTLYTRCRMVSL